MPANDVYRCAFEYIVWGQQCVNVLHFRQDAGATATKAQEVADELGPLLVTQYNGIVSNPHTTGILLRVQLISRTLSDLGEYSVNALQGVSYPGLPPQLAAVAKLRTGLAGRRKRGRIFIAGAALAQEGGVLTSTGATEWATWCGNFQNAFSQSGSAPYTLGVFSRTTWANGVSSMLDAFTAVTSVGPEIILATMRNRKPGVGA